MIGLPLVYISSVSIRRSNNTSQKLFLFDKMTASNKMTVKKLSEEVDRMKIKLEQMVSLQKKVLELKKSREIMKQAGAELGQAHYKVG